MLCCIHYVHELFCWCCRLLCVLSRVYDVHDGACLIGPAGGKTREGGTTPFTPSAAVNSRFLTYVFTCKREIYIFFMIRFVVIQGNGRSSVVRCQRVL